LERAREVAEASSPGNPPPNVGPLLKPHLSMPPLELAPRDGAEAASPRP
jgi:hypothetical protein